MAFPEEDLELDRAILMRLSEIFVKVALASDKYFFDNGASQTAFINSINDLTEKINSLTNLLGQSKDYAVDVNVTGADGAIQDLVSRVIEEVMVRVKQENLLTITNG